MNESNATNPATDTPADKLRALAATVRGNPHAREAIADAFDLIADQLKPCVDCQAQTSDTADTATPATETPAEFVAA